MRPSRSHPLLPYALHVGTDLLTDLRWESKLIALRCQGVLTLTTTPPYLWRYSAVLVHLCRVYSTVGSHVPNPLHYQGSPLDLIWSYIQASITQNQRWSPTVNRLHKLIHSF